MAKTLEKPHGEIAHDEPYHQFVDIHQQNESYIVGMWSFLVTEVMFFAGLFLAYIIYRWQYQPDFYLIHQELDWRLGGLNTVILLLSSFTMACAVHFAQKKDKANQLRMLAVTNLCAFGFLIVKGFEWKAKFEHGHIPWTNFTWPGGISDAALIDVPAGTAKMFFSIYFGMTGLHGIHVVIGIIAIGILMFMVWKKMPQVENYVHTECVGLYWHFVDLVWIFLFPLFYLMPK